MDLCGFLLQEFPSYRLDTALHEALKSFLADYWMIVCGRVEKCYLEQVMEEFYRLFLGRYGLVTDVHNLPRLDHAGCIIEYEEEEDTDHHNMVLTNFALQEVISSQPSPFSEWPLTQRLNSALRARGWPAKAFVRLINAGTSMQLATYADPMGKTALHWAAEHFGHWVARTDPRATHERVSMNQQSYGDLMVTLIRDGANLHALDYANETPFTYMLKGSCYGIHEWEPGLLRGAIQRWGTLMQDAGCCLPAYAEMENRLHASNAATKLKIWRMGNLWSYKLVVSGTSTLVLEVGGSLQLPIWEFRPPPGSWRRCVSRIDRIIWPPSPWHEGMDWDLWRKTNDFVLKLPLVRLRSPEPSHSLAESIARSWHQWVKGTQDDHGFVATTMQRSSRALKARSKRHRALSLPPPRTMLDKTSNKRIEERDLNFMAYHWMPTPHKCPLDLVWKSAYPLDGFFHIESRLCMQGRCGDGQADLLGTDHWEIALLGDDSNMEIAKPFMARFRPEWVSIVEDNARKAQRRVELGISNNVRVSPRRAEFGIPSTNNRR